MDLERRALIEPRAVGAARPAVQLHELVGDRQPEAEPVVPWSRRSGILAQPFEHVWQEVGTMPWPVSVTVIRTCSVRATDANIRSAFGCTNRSLGPSIKRTQCSLVMCTPGGQT